MPTFMLTLLMFVGLFLMFVILLQRGRGGGLAGAFGGLGGQSAFGTKAGDVFTVITVVTVVIWVALACVTGAVVRNSDKIYAGHDDADVVPKAAGEPVGKAPAEKEGNEPDSDADKGEKPDVKEAADKDATGKDNSAKRSKPSGEKTTSDSPAQKAAAPDNAGDKSDANSADKPSNDKPDDGENKKPDSTPEN